MSDAAVQKEMEALRQKMEELASDNAMLKLTVKTLTERLDELDADDSPKKDSNKGAASNKRSKSMGKKDNSSASLNGSDTKSVRSKSSGRMQKSQSNNRSRDMDNESDDGNTEENFGVYQVGKSKVRYVIPSDYKEQPDGKVPDASLKLEFIYGYNGRNCRNNLFYTDRNKNYSRLIYCTAAAGVYYDPQEQAQSFFLEHNEDITALAVHPTEPVVATGQSDPKGGEKPFICIWDYTTMRQLQIIEGFHDRSVCALAFSANGKYLASVGNDDNHVLAIWEWQKEVKEPAATSSVSKDAVYGISTSMVSKEAFEFVTYGAKQIKIWQLQKKPKSKDKAVKPGMMLKSKVASSFNETNEVQKAYYSAYFIGEDQWVAGTASGSIYMFDCSGKFLNNVASHAKAVGAMCRVGSGFATASNDGLVKIWSADCKLEKDINLSEVLNGGKPKAMDFTPVNGGSIVIGTHNNCIVEISMEKAKSPVYRMQGHFNEIWALAVHPKDKVVVTGGHDKILRAWDFEKKAPVFGKILEFKANIRSCAIHPEGDRIAVGFQNGRIALVDYNTFQPTYQNKHRNEQIDAINFSRNGQLLALGSYDQVVELIDLDTMSSIALKGHTSSISHLTFSLDSKYLQTNSRDYEILFWNCETGTRIEGSEVANVKWHDWQNILGWPVKSIFTKGMDGTDVNAVSISGDPEKYENRTVAVGDDFGLVHIYKFPANGKNAKDKKYKGHSSHVTNVRFSPSGQYLFSAGGNDSSIFQWRHKL